MFSNIRQHFQVMMGQSKTLKTRFWMIQIAKKQVFGHFLDLGLLDRLDIADFDRSKCPSTFSKVARSQRIVQK